MGSKYSLFSNLQKNLKSAILKRAYFWIKKIQKCAWNTYHFFKFTKSEKCTIQNSILWNFYTKIRNVNEIYVHIYEKSEKCSNQNIIFQTSVKKVRNAVKIHYIFKFRKNWEKFNIQNSILLNFYTKNQKCVNEIHHMFIFTKNQF